jgi:hypothetical protein
VTGSTIDPGVPDGARRPLGSHHVPDAAVPWLRRSARLWGGAAFLGWLLWRLTQGVPRAGEAGWWQATIEIGLWAVAVTGYVVALEVEIIGATIMAGAGAGFALWVSQYHDPMFGIAMLVLFSVPAVLYWLVWQRYRPIWQLASLGALLAAIVAVGALGAFEVWKATLGPTHPASVVEPLPDSAVTWVWSGGITSTSAEVRARVDGDAATSRLAVSPTSDLTGARFITGRSASTDDSQLVAFTVTGLEPATTYHYAIEVEGELDRVRTGTFGTFGEGAWDFTLASASCARVGSNGAVFDAIRSVEPDLFVMDGDLFYGDVASNDRARIREFYDGVNAQPGPAALYRSVPWAYVWDDHDYGPNDADSTSDSRPAAQTVFREVVPTHELVRDGQQPIHRAFTIGRARVIITDTRSARSPKEDPDGPDKTMLGPDQLAWFLDELRAADGVYPLIIWVSSVPWIGPAEDGADHWGGYDHERRLIADFIAEEGIDGILMLAGDAHMVAIDDGTNSDFSSSGRAGFPVLQAAALDRPGSAKGGTYSHGIFPGGGRFGVVEVLDDGTSMQVTLRGLTWDGQELTSLSYVIDGTEEASAW